MGRAKWLTILASVSAVAMTQTLSGTADTNPQPIDFTHNVIGAPAPVSGASFDSTATDATGIALCSTTTSASANVNTDCNDPRGVGPHNETSIAINPTDASNIVGGANDYQLSANPDGHVTETILSRAHVTTDGGRTWSEYSLNSNSAYQATGDPSLTFDGAGNAYYATLGFRFVGPGNAQSPDVLVAHSFDKGKTWDSVRVASGSGVFTSVGDLLDKEYVAGWGNGNVIVTYGDFRQGPHGITTSVRIFSSVSHDFGVTWSTPTVISGDLIQAFGSMPVVVKNGSSFLVYAAFLNTAHSNGRDDYDFERLDPATGAPIPGTFKTIDTLFDGATDYPIAFGRQTYQDSVFRNGLPVSIAADPKNPLHVAAVWSDMRDSTLPAPPDPYTAKTNSDVVVSESKDGGSTWSTATPLMLSNDQFMPWGAFDSSGRLRIGFFDRQGDSANHLYNYSLATETAVGSLAFTVKTVSTVSSDPTTGDRWFARNVNPAFPHATAFMGDYSNIAALPSGGVVAYWTDMRNDITFGRTGHGEDAYFAVVG